MDRLFWLKKKSGYSKLTYSGGMICYWFWFSIETTEIWFLDLLWGHNLMLFNRLVVSDSLLPHGLQHARLPCPSLSPGVCSSSCPLNWWWHPTISSSVASFSSCPQSFPASGSFPMNQLFTSGGPSTGASASAPVLPVNIQGWFPLGLTGLSPCCPRDSQESLLQHHSSKASLALSLL